MIAEYSNSRNVTDAASRQTYQEGRRLYRDGQPDSECRSKAALDGWWDAAATCAAPEELGMWDARQGEPFAPECYYARRNDMALYTLGFLAEQPENEAALAYMRSVEAQADEDYAAMQYEMAEQRGY